MPLQTAPSQIIAILDFLTSKTRRSNGP